MKILMPIHICESLGLEVPIGKEGLFLECEGGKVINASWGNFPKSLKEIEDPDRILYGELLRIADFYRSIEGGIEMRVYGIDFKKLEDSEGYRKDGKLVDPDFAFSYPETRDIFYQNFRDDLIKIKDYIKLQYR